MTKELFTPFSFRNMQIKTRLVRSATEFFCSDTEGHITGPELDAYRLLAKQPLGMIITGHTCVSPDGRSNMWQNAAWDESYADDLKTLSDAAGSDGVPVILQLGHGGMKAEGNNGGRRVFTPDNMTHEDIKQLSECFGRAAAMAKQCGFAGVMIHCAHLYLLSQFLYPEYNHRTDEYGGINGGFNVTLRVLDKIKETCGEDFPVFMKINSTDRSLSADYTKNIGNILNSAYEHGLEGAEISGWDSAPAGKPKAPYFIEQVRTLHEMTDLPLIEVGGIRSGEDAKSVLDAGAAAVSMCRPLLCEPDFPSRLLNEDNAQSECRGCCRCFLPLEGSERCVMNRK